MNLLIKYAAQLELYETVDALWQGAIEVFSNIGFDHAIYLSVDADFGNLFLRSTMQQLYSNTPPKEDPFLIHACTRYEITAIGTEFMADHPYVSDADRAFIKNAAEQGFCAGLGIPMRLKGGERFGGFLLGTSLDRETFLDDIMPRAEELRLFCMIIHRRLEELSTEQDQDSVVLSSPPRRALVPNALPAVFEALAPREVEVIIQIAQGQTRKAAAHSCGLSVHTVSDYVKSAYKKLGVRNRAEAATLLYGQPQIKRAGR